MCSSSFPARFWGHLKTITLHKLRVTRLCFKMGLIKQGLLHDLSKYSPVEFWAGVRYFQGYRSPIDAEKEAKGYSEGWLHHKGHNKHHWEYWIDRNKQCQGLFCVEIPKRYVAEMVCDRIAACQTYQKEKYTNASPIEYFLQGSDKQFMHPHTAALLQQYLEWVSDFEIDAAFKKIKQDLRRSAAI